LENITVIITEPINEVGIKFLKNKGVNVIEFTPESTIENLSTKIAEADGIITRGSIKITRKLMTKSPRLKVIGVHGIGCDHVDLEAAKDLSKIVCNTPDALTTTVAEMAMALTLALLRHVVVADTAVRKGQWARKYDDLIGVELSGKKVGIIGLGRIGSATAKRMKAFGADVRYWSRTRKPKIEEELDIKYVKFIDLIKTCDIISLHIPSTPETLKIIGAREIASMKDGVFLINTARGKVIDQDAMITALQSGKIRGAALDVFENEPLNNNNPLCELSNVILTPHLGASNVEGLQKMAYLISESVYNTINGGKPINRVI